MRSLTPTIRREMEVAFSRHAQPVWFRLLKWAVFISVSFLLWDTDGFVTFVSLFVAGGITLHLIWRHNTQRWTRSWGGWKYEDHKPNGGT